MLIESILIALSVLMLLMIIASYRQLSHSIGASAWPHQLSRYPSVTIIRPIKGLDHQARQNIEAALESYYPGDVETIFVFDDDDEPALPLVREILARPRSTEGNQTARVIFCGHPPAQRTGKLQAMIAGLREAKHELVAFVDSDTRADPRTLTVLVETLLGAPAAGVAFAPVVATLPAKTFGDAGYALLLNGLYDPAAAITALRHDGELPFIMGQFMIFFRKTLAAIGGLESADGQIVDDMYLGALVKKAGLRNIMAPKVVPIIQQGLSAIEFWKTYQRWIIFSRTGLPGWSFKRISWQHGIIFWTGLISAACSAGAGFSWAAGLAALASLGVAASINRLHRRLGGGPLALRHFWVSFALLLIAPVVFALVLFSRRVEWRGRTYFLDAQARLASPTERPAKHKFRTGAV